MDNVPKRPKLNPGRMSTENVPNREEENDEIGALDALNALEKEASEYKKVPQSIPLSITASNPPTLGRRN